MNSTNSTPGSANAIGKTAGRSVTGTQSAIGGQAPPTPTKHGAAEPVTNRIKHVPLVGSAIVFSIFANLLMLTGPLFMLQIYDRVLSSRSEETLVALTTLVVFLYLSFWILEFSRSRVMARVGTRMHAALKEDVFDAVLERSSSKIVKSQGSLNDLEGVRSFLSSPVVLAVFDVPWTPLFLILIFVFHPVLGWFSLGGGALLVVIALINQILTYRMTREGEQFKGSAQLFAQEAERGAELLSAQGMRKAMAGRWAAKQDAAVESMLSAADWTGSFTSFAKAFRLFLQSAILAVGAYLVLQNELSAGAMIAASIVLGRALAPIEIILGQWSTIQRARENWQNLRSLLSMHPKKPLPMALPDPASNLVAQDISVVAQDARKPVLKRISMSVRPGEAVGVIGKSGSGKTTLARVLVGLVKPIAGEVRLAGATLDQYGLERLGRYIGYLPQDVQLFPGSIAENIAQMEQAADPSRVVAAAKKARIHETVLQLADGYDTEVGLADKSLSGGQKQRLALARALYNDPVLLVLDEPNSALDAEGSEALNITIKEMKSEGRGVIIMTHRPTAIASCDKLLILEKGNAVAYGPRDDIIRSALSNAGEIESAVKEKAS